jgi:hypothetical protein
MGYYQREFIAKSAGLNDASELALVMKGRYDLLSDSIAGSSQSYEDAAERAQQMASFQEKLNILFASMIPIITPLIDMLISLGDFFANNAKTLKLATGALLLFGGALATLSGVGATAGISSMVAGFMMLADSTEKAKGKMTALGLFFRVLKAAFKPTIAFLKGFLSIFYVVGEVISDYLNDPATLTMLEGFVIRIEQFFDIMATVADRLGREMARAMVIITAAWSAIAGIAGAVNGLGAAIASGSLGGAITYLSEVMLGFVGALTAVTGAVGALASRFWEEPFNPPSFFLGLFEMADAFIGLAKAALTIINPFMAVAKAVQAIGDTFHHILTGASQFFNLLTSDAAVENVRALAEATNNVNVTKAAALAGVSIATTAGAVAASGANALAGAVNAVTGNTAGGAAGNEMTVNQPVEIKINGDVLEKFIISVVGENVRSIRVTQS